MVGALCSARKMGMISKNGGILREKGTPSAAGFRIDTGYYNNDPLDKIQKQAGQGYRGYGTFVKNDSKVILLK